MGLFSAIVKTVVNVATLPVAVVKDSAMLMADAATGDGEVFPRTAEKLEQIKEEARDE